MLFLKNRSCNIIQNHTPIDPLCVCFLEKNSFGKSPVVTMVCFTAKLVFEVVKVTESCGAIRHGAECFNFYFPQASGTAERCIRCSSLKRRAQRLMAKSRMFWWSILGFLGKKKYVKLRHRLRSQLLFVSQWCYLIQLRVPIMVKSSTNKRKQMPVNELRIPCVRNSCSEHRHMNPGWWLEPWNFMTFHSVISSSQLTNSLHHFSEGLGSTTNQVWMVK